MMSNFYLWTIYKHPKDYPDSYVARKFVGETPTNEVIVSKRLEVFQDEFEISEWISICVDILKNPGKVRKPAYVLQKAALKS
jgi:hypothetical protein